MYAKAQQVIHNACCTDANQRLQEEIETIETAHAMTNHEAKMLKRNHASASTLHGLLPPLLARCRGSHCGVP